MSNQPQPKYCPMCGQESLGVVQFGTDTHSVITHKPDGDDRVIKGDHAAFIFCRACEFSAFIYDYVD